MTTGTKDNDQRLTHPAYRADIDGLRAVAVLSVVTFHAFPSVLRGGFIGVDIFFVISGFLISTILFASLEKNTFSILDFYIRRIRRIFPALVLVLLTCLAFGWALLLSDEYRNLGKHVAAGATFISNLALWNESGYFDAAADQKPLLHLWSLGIEEQFYVFWPVLLWNTYRRQKSFLVLTIGIAVLSFIVNVATVKEMPVAAFYSPLSRFWELMIGGILAFLKLHKPGYATTGSAAFSLVGIMLIGGALYFLSASSEFPGWWALLPTMGAFLIMSASPSDWFNRLVLSNPIMVAIGLISYPLYLWHWPVLYLGALVSPLPSRITRTLAVALSILLASLTYLLIEKPLRRSRLTTRSPVYLSAAMALCGVFGLAAYWTGGFPFRLPRQFLEFARSAPEARHSDCFLINDETFMPKCTDSGQRPLIFLWGDSHANALYSGLEPLAEGHEIGVVQITGASCPPLLNFKSNGNAKCEDINRYALATIRRRRPDVVLLDANWAADSIDLAKLGSTIEQVKSTGAGNVVLMGPVPRWSGTLLHSMFRCWHPKSVADEFPLYSTCGLDPQTHVVDAKLRDLATQFHIKYISAIDVLCNASGCLTRVNDGNGDELTTYDYGHLSSGGARYLVKTVAKELF